MLVAGAGLREDDARRAMGGPERQVAWVRARRSSADVAVLARQMAAAAAEILPDATVDYASG